jgi:hypothetical protein
MNMNRFNAFLAVFAILMVSWLIVDGPPRPPLVRIPTQSPTSTNILSFDILSNGVRIADTRNDAGEWQGATLPPAIAEAVALLIENMLVEFTQLVTFDERADLAQYGLTPDERRYSVSFDSVATGQAETFTFFVGDTTTSQREYYTVFVNLNTDSYRGEWVYTVPTVYIERLDELVSLLAEQSQSSGQTTEP